MTATKLEGRLLCACNVTYRVTSGGPVHLGALEPFGSGAGFISDPVGFLSPSGMDSCLVGTIPDGVVMAFRGTIPIDDETAPIELRIRDWINNFRAKLTNGQNLPGRVHNGFCLTLESLWTNAVTEAKHQLAALGGTPNLYITGHSKGGGVAILAAMRWLNETGQKPLTVTFAAPKAANGDFRQAFEAANLRLSRYEYQDDFVPHVPPSSRSLAMLGSISGQRFEQLDDHNYENVGQLRFINWNENIESPTNVINEFVLNSQRNIAIARLLAEGKFRKIVDDHRIGCKSGFSKVLTGVEVCV